MEQAVLSLFLLCGWPLPELAKTVSEQVGWVWEAYGDESLYKLKEGLDITSSGTDLLKQLKSKSGELGVGAGQQQLPLAGIRILGNV